MKQIIRTRISIYHQKSLDPWSTGMAWQTAHFCCRHPMPMPHYDGCVHDFKRKMFVATLWKWCEQGIQNEWTSILQVPECHWLSHVLIKWSISCRMQNTWQVQQIMFCISWTMQCYRLWLQTLGHRLQAKDESEFMVVTYILISHSSLYII